MTLRVLLVLATCLVAACSSGRRTEVPLPARDPTRLDHEKHAQIACGSCHRTEGVRPGADDHKPCDDGACHKSAFVQPPSLFCQVCHAQITTAPLEAPLKPYPRDDDAWRNVPSKFSHAKHLDADLMETRVGFHVSCTDCHTRGSDDLARPDHGTCARCHAPEAAPSRAPTMATCAGCHQRGFQERARKRLITGDLHFAHERHRSDRTGQPIKCDVCHSRSFQAKGYDDHAAPQIERCVGCHDDSARVPYTMRMRICETCHAERTSTLTAIAPRSHLPTSERPLDHTLAFRRDHGEVAARDTARCASCHVQMSGNARQACDECHQTMLPADHRITFRELDHGPEAVADRNRCATCHVVEFCTACHSQRPRSHGMVGSFTTEHGRLARMNVRACFTCHVAGPSNGALPEGGSTVFCGDCHAGGAPP